MATVTLNDVLADPGKVRTLPRAVRSDLLAQCAAVIVTLSSVADSSETKGKPDEADEMLTVEEAAALLRCQPRWVWRHKKRLGFVRQTGPRSLLCSKRGIENWLASRKAR